MLHRRTSIVFLAVLFAAASLQAVTYIMPNDRDFVAQAKAVIVGIAGESHAEVQGDGSIVTVTYIRVDETLKGSVSGEIRLVEPGGVFGNRAVVIPGMPAYVPGKRYLVFLHHNNNGWTTLGMGLGQFEFTTDLLTQRELVMRSGWRSDSGFEADGSPHVELLRDATGFLDFIRVAGRNASAPASTNYMVQPSTTVRGEFPEFAPLKPAPDFTRQSYLMSLNARWKNPTQSFAYCCSGTPSGATAGGTAANGLDGPAAMTTAFNNWNGTGTQINYKITGQDDTAKGRLLGLGGGVTDGKNAIIFNDPYNDILTQFGVSNVAAVGGYVTTGFSYTLGTETFNDIAEADVVAGRFASLPIGQATYAGVVTHEFGHTLGFRHADGTANSVSPPPNCDPSTMDCAGVGQAIMAHIIGSGLQTLQPWDLRAAQTVYGGNCTTGGTQLCINGSRYRVTVVAKDPSGKTGDGTANGQSDVFGYFTLPTLASASDPQIFVKVIGTTPWVFYAGLTNLDYTLTVYDTWTEKTFNTYHVVPPLSDPRSLTANQSLGDYDVNGINAHDPAQKNVQCAPTTVTSATTTATPGNCPNNTTSLCLLNRFTVTLNAKVNNPSGATSAGNTLPGNNQFGFFTTPAIAGQTDVQAFIKMLDATSLNNFFWVFLGGLTDFELNFTVTDTQTGRQRIYKKPAGSTCGWNDTSAFSAP